MTFTKPIKYNPAFLTQEELIRSFVVRNADLELIMEWIRENRGQANQHVLIVGPRGSGKTTLALRVAAELRKDRDAMGSWYPIVFAEESYEVCSPGEFWLEALFHVGKQTGDDRWKGIHKELRTEMDESRLRDRALAHLMDFADLQGKRLLFIVENLNMLLGQQLAQEAAWDIRHTLVNEPRIMLLGTATSRFEQLENSDKAMFELFKIHELEPLGSDDCRTLWKSITGQELLGDRIRPIQILTGGSPRLLVIISVFAARASFRELMEDLTHLVDEHTEYFKSHIDNLPPLERKVFVTLADLWQPSTAREVAQAARIGVNKASAYLKRLFLKGAVMEVEQAGGKKWYQIAERMYNIYHLMRRRGEPSNRVRAVVDFMVHFYSDEDLVKTISSIAEEACGIDLEERSDHYQALIEILKAPQIKKYRQKIVHQIPRKLFDSPDLPEALREMAGPLPAPSVEPVSFTEEELQSVRPNNPEDPNAWIELGKILEKEAERLEDAEHAYREALRIDSGSIAALGKLALLLRRTGRFEEAEEAYKEIMEIDSEIAWVWREYGFLLQYKLKRYEEAEKAYQKSIEIDSGYSIAWSSLGFLLYINSERYDEAEKAFRKAIDLEPDDTFALGGLGFLMQHIERYKEAEEAFIRLLEINPKDSYIAKCLGDLYRMTDRYEEAVYAYKKSIDIDPNNKSVWVNLGFILSLELSSYKEAEQAFHKAIDLDSGYSRAWSNLGSLLIFGFERYEESEKAFRTAIDLDPDDAFAWGGLGFLLQCLERYEEAEEAYIRALKINPTDSFITKGLGDIFRMTDRYKEAEQAYHKALEIDQNNTGCWMDLIALQMDDMRAPEEALHTAQEAIESADRSPEMLNAVARAFYQNGWSDYLDTAEIWSREALEKEPDNPAYLLTLALILSARTRWEEAIEISLKFLQSKEFISENMNAVTSFFIHAAAAGHAEKSLDILESSYIKNTMEPLVTGLKLFLGEKTRAPQEVMEIGKDVATRIDELIGGQ